MTSRRGQFLLSEIDLAASVRFAKIPPGMGKTARTEVKMVHAGGGFAYASRGRAYDPIL